VSQGTLTSKEFAFLVKILSKTVKIVQFKTAINKPAFPAIKCSFWMKISVSRALLFASTAKMNHFVPPVSLDFKVT
jgi:hypothetical protein